MLNPLRSALTQRLLVKALTLVSVMGMAAVGLSGGPAIARPEKNVLLQYDSSFAEVPLADLEQLAETGTASDELSAYLQTTPLTEEDLAAVLSFEIYTGTIPFSSTNVNFAAIQLSKAIGDPLRRERYRAMRRALRESFEGDRAITVIEIVENYPSSRTRISLDQIDQLFGDVALFVNRVEPVLSVIKLLLPELVCDCGFNDGQIEGSAPGRPLGAAEAAAMVTAQGTKQSRPCDRLASGLKQITPGETPTPLVPSPPDALSRPDAIIPTDIAVPLTPTAGDSAAQLPEPINERIVIDFGPLRPSFKVRDLEKFVETGVLPRAWRLYLRVAGLNAEGFRTALTQEVDVDLLFLDGLLNNILGEYLLFQVGHVIHTRSGSNNIQALRAALVLSAADDNKISLFEFLKNYPERSVILDGLNLARFGSNLSRRGAVGTATAGLEDMLLELQAGIADDICDCPDDAEL